MKLQAFLLVIATVITVTATAQLPTDQQDTHFAMELQSQTQSVGVESLKAGQIVEVQYKAPNSGHAIVNLRADYIFYAGSRIPQQTNLSLIVTQMGNGYKSSLSKAFPLLLHLCQAQ